MLTSFRSCSCIAAVFSALLAAGCSRNDEAAAKPAPAVREVGVVTLKTERVAFNTELPGRAVAPLMAEIRP